MDKKKLSAVVERTRQILKEHPLCDNCLGRMFAGNLGVKSHERLGKEIRRRIGQKSPQTCYICKNLMATIDLHAKKMIEASKGYQFSTFLIGAILQPSIHDRDDTIRSKFRLRGITSIKSDITRELGKKFSRRTKSSVDYQNPDMVFTIDFKRDYCEIKPKALLLQGRYIKDVRGFPQKQKPCDECQGRGCFVCDFHGIKEFDSVEGKIARFFIEKYGAMQAKITWIGGEDESSLVLGNGRPFFAKLISPHKRETGPNRKVDLDGISILGLRIINKIPSEPIKFRTVVVMDIESENEIEPKQLENLRKLRAQQIILYENSHHNKKRVYDVHYKPLSSNSIRVKIESDGGMPIKRLVAGHQVEPNISGLLETNCRCTRFDFNRITVTR
ncbi:MAG TPA: tRNA pseudouridine(54/55) synthase Pus10 [Candidatus Nitrosotalea sp.]|nr:tRNA pseudouridine(54/55) synthase Pus10 [Candidatus Nitrosotalea sp.]